MDGFSPAQPRVSCQLSEREDSLERHFLVEPGHVLPLISVRYATHFRKGRPYWIWLTFKSGQVMAGLFGPNSFAGSFPNRQDIYVEQLLSLDEDGKVKALIENSAGAIVRMDDLERIEFFEIEGVTI